MPDDSRTTSLRVLIPWRSATFHVIIASSLIGVMGVSLISPVLPELRDAFGVSDAQVGLVITAYTLPGVFITPVVGVLADRIGRKRILVPLLLVFGASGAAIAFTTDFAVLLVLRVLQGIGATALIMLAITLIGDIYEGAQRDALIGVNGSMIGIGAAFFPLVGGGLAVIAWNVPFLIYGVGVLVGVVALFVLDEPTRDGSTGMRTYLHRMGGLFRMPQPLALFGALFAAIFVFYGAVITALPLLLSDEFGLSPGLIGPVLAMVSVTNATVASLYGRIAPLRTGPQLVALGFVTFGTGLLFIGIAPSIAVIVVGTLCLGAALGVIFPSVDSTILTEVSEDLRAGMMGMRTSIIRLGQTLGPVGFTVTAEAFYVVPARGYRVLIVIASAIILVSGIVGYTLLRR